MKRPRPAVIVSALAIAATGFVTDAAAMEPLRFDPFGLLLGAPASETPPEEPPPRFGGRLLMTLRDGQGGLVNIGGRTVALGETIDGFRVTDIAERAVVLTRGDEHVVLTLDGEENTDE